MGQCWELVVSGELGIKTPLPLLGDPQTSQREKKVHARKSNAPRFSDLDPLSEVM